MRIDERADLSIEICHLYGDELDVEHLTEGIGAAAPIVELVRSRRPDWSISVCVLVDDYFGSVQQSSDEIRSMIEEASGITSLSVDHVVSEAGLAESVGFLLNRLLPRPSAGAGSKEKGADADRFVSNNQGAIDAEGDTEGPLFVEWAERVPARQASVPRSGLSHRAQRGHHALDLTVELWNSDPDLPTSTIYSCSLLAAWWQLVRLGYLMDVNGTPLSPEGSISLGKVPLTARRTLSVLDNSYLEIEHAVRTILGDFVEAYRSGLWGDETQVDGEQPCLDNIAYFFLNRRFLGTGANTT